MEIIVIPAAAPFDQVQRAVADAKPTHLVGYACHRTPSPRYDRG
jgi:hypothetical protein